MSIEIEKKYRLTADRSAEIERELKDLGAIFVREDFEVNTIYAGEALERRGGIIRIRTTEGRAVLTFKRRLENEADAKHQVEHETEISDANAGERILNELGLSAKLLYEKKRMTWKFRRAEIVLDELPFGLFMEIEGPLIAIKEMEILLGIEDLQIEHETYPRLTAQFGKRIGDKIEARFS